MVDEIVAEEDPIVQYIIVRESLIVAMGMGKTIAQCCHAEQYILVKYFKFQLLHAALKHNPEAEAKIIHHEDNEHMRLTSKWLNNGCRKVILKADDKEWAKIKEEFSKNHALVIDAGLTCIPAGSETCIALWPQMKSERSKLIKRLQVL